MDKTSLLQSAKSLKQIGNTAAGEYEEKRNLLVQRVNIAMLQKEDILHLIGQENTEMMKSNHSNHAEFISSILVNFNENVLVQTVLWVFRAYRSHGFSPHYWEIQLNTWIEILGEELTAASLDEIAPLYEWLKANIPQFTMLSDNELNDSLPLC